MSKNQNFFLFFIYVLNTFPRVCINCTYCFIFAYFFKVICFFKSSDRFPARKSFYFIIRLYNLQRVVFDLWGIFFSPTWLVSSHYMPTTQQNMCNLHNFATSNYNLGNLRVPQGFHIVYLYSRVSFKRVFGFSTHPYISPCRMRADIFT